MKFLAYILALGLAAGCSTPPKPHDCSGEFRPLNIERQSSALDKPSNLALCKAEKNHG